ncbi:hypothetical protein SAMN05421787_12330 [Virgibacillus pantothenticus]|nr:hypothetical protein SAMN05421787_12330 [Virgibacillus pantothenticus]
MTIGKVDKSVKIWTEIYDKIDSVTKIIKFGTTA